MLLDGWDFDDPETAEANIRCLTDRWTSEDSLEEIQSRAAQKEPIPGPGEALIRATVGPGRVRGGMRFKETHENGVHVLNATFTQEGWKKLQTVCVARGWASKVATTAEYVKAFLTGPIEGEEKP